MQKVPNRESRVSKGHSGELWDAKPISLEDDPVRSNVKPIQDRWNLDIESGMIWKVSNETPLDYTIAPQIISLRGPRHFWGHAFSGKWVIRPQYSFLGEAIIDGPESRYFGLSAAPSIEWWNSSEQAGLFLAVGGGIGWIDSQDTPGGQGQDFTFNWFIKSGVRYRLDDHWFVSAAVFFQHLSNRGMTDPNPGIDALGGLVGVSYAF